MRSVPSIESLNFEDLEPGVVVQGMEQLEDCTRLAVFTGALLLDNLHVNHPELPVVDPLQTIGTPYPNRSTIGEYFLRQLGVSEIDLLAIGAVFVQPTKPVAISLVRGEYRNFVSTIQLGRDLLCSVEAGVFVECTHRYGKEDQLYARKRVIGKPRMQTRQEYLEWLNNHLLYPRMKAKSLDAGKLLEEAS